MKGYILLALLFCAISVRGQEEQDPNIWLEDIDGVKALQWVKAHNESTISVLEKYSAFEQIKAKNEEILNFKERIAYPTIRKNYMYNFWQDEKNERGLWRRTTLQEYLKKAPKWEVLIDFDSLSKIDNEKWVYKGVSFLYPDLDRCMVRISRGGGDAVIIKEFDVEKKQFVKDGFVISETKGSTSWKDRNTLYVAVDFRKGSLTQSGYPRIAKLWKRGTPLSDAKTIFEGDTTDVSTQAYTIFTPERSYEIIQRGLTFYKSNIFAIEKGELKRLEFQDDAQFDMIFKGQIILELKSDWDIGGKKYLQGSVISIDYDKFLQGDRSFAVIVAPEARSSVSEVNSTKDFLLIKKLHNVQGELYRYYLINGTWVSKKVDAPKFGDISIWSGDDFSGKYFFSFRNFLTPASLFYADDKGKINKIKSLPDFFDAKKFKVEQLEAVSKDGTKIPYFLVHAKNMKFNSAQPTLLEAYGGFEVSMEPYYSGVLGSGWLERGGVYAYANLRGGGEFGPQWHLSSIKENRQNVNDDMIAVSEDLIKRNITSPKHLGIIGGSNGGLLVGSVAMQRPELYNAVVCEVPLLDMKRYNKLLAGASWMGEYGNPDIPEEWAYIKKYSPYQNVFADKTYPKIFFKTSTRDDRVHPGHARKMAAKMEALKHPFYYYENTEGGHSAGVTNKQVAFEEALVYAYLFMQLQ